MSTFVLCGSLTGNGSADATPASLASVLALSSFSFSAFADETEFDENVQAVDKAELENYLNSSKIKALIDGDINNYGTISGQRFTDAVQFAEVVLNDSSSEKADYTVAYRLVKAEADQLVQYDAKQLAALIEQDEAIYNTENILNDNGDQIYDGDDWNTFTDAYENAQYFVDSTDLRDTTDAYELLDEADDMSKLETVTKAQFAAARKAYEAALENEFKYQAWQRGTVSGTDTNYDGKTYAWGTLYAHVASISEKVTDYYEKLDAIKSSKGAVSSDPAIVLACNECERAAAILNGFKKDSVSGTNYGTLLKKYNSRLVHDFAEDTSTIWTGITGLTVDEGSIDIWTGDGVAAPSWKTLVVDSSNTADITDKSNPIWYLESAEVTNKADGSKGLKAERLDSASLKLRNSTGKSIYFVLDDTKKTWAGKSAIKTSQTATTTAPTAGENESLLEWKNGTSLELSDYIMLPDSLTSTPITADNLGDDKTYDDIMDTTENSIINAVIDKDNDEPGFDKQLDSATLGAEWTTTDGKYTDAAEDEKQAIVDLATAYDAVVAAEAYKAAATAEKADKLGEYQTAYAKIDERGEVNGDNVKSSSKELGIVYKYLAYALADKYDATVENAHKLADVTKMIDDSYTLAEATVDTALFTTSHMALFNARNDALDWKKLVTKENPYKENVTAATYGETEDAIANTVYDDIKAKYDQLNNEQKAFSLSFGEVYDLIAEVSIALDEGGFNESDAKTLIEKIDATASALNRIKNVVDTNGNELADNEPFTVDREFNPNNRVFTNESKFESLMIGTTEFKVAAAKNGANQSHYDLKTAYEELKTAYDKIANEKIR